MLLSSVSSSLCFSQAAAALWPEYFADESIAAQKPVILEKMKQVRPVVETGYENVVQVDFC